MEHEQLDADATRAGREPDSGGGHCGCVVPTHRTMLPDPIWRNGCSVDFHTRKWLWDRAENKPLDSFLVSLRPAPPVPLWP